MLILYYQRPFNRSTFQSMPAPIAKSDRCGMRVDKVARVSGATVLCTSRAVCRILHLDASPESDL